MSKFLRRSTMLALLCAAALSNRARADGPPGGPPMVTFRVAETRASEEVDRDTDEAEPAGDNADVQQTSVETPLPTALPAPAIAARPIWLSDEPISFAAKKPIKKSTVSKPAAPKVKGHATAGPSKSKTVASVTKDKIKSASPESLIPEFTPPADEKEEKSSDGVPALLASKLQQPPPQTPDQPPPQTAPTEQRDTSAFEQALRTRLAGYRASPVDSVVTSALEGPAQPSVDMSLRESSQAPSIELQRRNPVVFDPHIRGYNVGQIYSQANGALLAPVRQDMTSFLSNLDPTYIDRVEVISGPYGLRYGPGFSYINVVGTPAPRYDRRQTEFRTGMDVRANGGQMFGRQTVMGGDRDWGYRFSYVNRTGSAYRDATGQKIDAAYNNQNFDFTTGFDLAPDQVLEFRFNHLDQNNAQFPLVFWNISNLNSNAYTTSFVDTDARKPWSELRLEGWTNLTQYIGNNQGQGKAIMNDRVDQAIDTFFGTSGSQLQANTTGYLSSSGGRQVVTFGDAGERQLRLGNDLRYLSQQINESFTLIPPNPGLAPFQTNLPTSWMVNPGLFNEVILPHGDWTTTIGARLDWVNTNTREKIVPGTAFFPTPTPLPNGSRNDVLYAFFMQNKLQFSKAWSFDTGFGQAQHAPTLTQRYADGLFLAVAQDPFTRVIGDPNLAKERAWQIDAGLTANYDSFRSRLRGYQSFILDYITFKDNFIQFPPNNPSSAHLLQYTNTHLATLSGFDFNAEYDVNERLTPFAFMGYVYGRDQSINQPLPQIYPFDSRVGIRIHDTEKGKRWSWDTGIRMVSRQTQAAKIRSGAGVTPLEMPTAGFATVYTRWYWNYSQKLRFNAGIDNMFNKLYFEHLDQRLAAQGSSLPFTAVWAPGITPYAGIDWTF